MCLCLIIIFAVRFLTMPTECANPLQRSLADSIVLMKPLDDIRILLACGAKVNKIKRTLRHSPYLTKTKYKTKLMMIVTCVGEWTGYTRFASIALCGVATAHRSCQIADCSGERHKCTRRMWLQCIAFGSRAWVSYSACHFPVYSFVCVLFVCIRTTARFNRNWSQLCNAIYFIQIHSFVRLYIRYVYQIKKTWQTCDCGRQSVGVILPCKHPTWRSGTRIENLCCNSAETKSQLSNMNATRGRARALGFTFYVIKMVRK